MKTQWLITNELYHHGIKGQKWGIRRYQNEDGTLTEEGKKRYEKLGLTSDEVLKYQEYEKQYKEDLQYYMSPEHIKETIKEVKKDSSPYIKSINKNFDDCKILNKYGFHLDFAKNEDDHEYLYLIDKNGNKTELVTDLNDAIEEHIKDNNIDINISDLMKDSNYKNIFDIYQDLEYILSDLFIQDDYHVSKEKALDNFYKKINKAFTKEKIDKLEDFFLGLEAIRINGEKPRISTGKKIVGGILTGIVGSALIGTIVASTILASKK